MKKFLFNTGFIVLCVGAIVFLLLPFLETTPPVTSSLNAGPAQVISSNPLADIVRRLAPLFGRKERTCKTLTPQQQIAQAQQQTQPQTLASFMQLAQGPSNMATAPAQTITLPPTEKPFDYDQAAFQTDGGEWVLVRQTAPQSSSPGMHEVNVHENPYERYLRQERARHFSPPKNQQEIPDSKWARWTRPIKSFFGFADAQPVGNADIRVQQGTDRLASLPSEQDKLSSVGSKISSNQLMRLPLPDITPQQWAQLTLPEREQLQQRHAARDFAELLTGEGAARKAAEALAQAKYPNPKNPKEQKEKAAYTQRLTEELKQNIKEGLMANIQADAAGKEPADELAYMTGCKDSSLPPQSCPDNPPPAQHVPAGILAQASEQNAQTFFNETKFILPQGLPFTVVLGPTDPETFQNTQQNAATAEIYQFLSNQLQCDTRTCYWFPNTNQPDPKLSDTITTIGQAKLYTDPFHIYNTYKDAFVQYKIQQLGPDATPEQIAQIQQQAPQQWEQNRPNWVPGREEHLVQLNQDTLEALKAPLDQPSAKTPIFPIVTDPAVAPQVAQLIGPNFVYSKTQLLDSDSPLVTGQLLTHSLSTEVNSTKQVIQQTVQPLYQQAVGMNLGGLYNQAAQQNNQNGSGFAGLLEAVKRWGNHDKK